MIIRSFLQWVASAPAAARAEGARALGQAYLTGEIDPAERAEAEVALAALVDDPSPLVRMALAHVFAADAQSPSFIVTALASDQPDIAALVLRQSPVLSEAELVDAVAVGGIAAQIAVAYRARLSESVSAALAEVGSLEGCVALCRNPSAVIEAESLHRIVERFGSDAGLRETLLQRPDLDPGLRHDLVVATAEVLGRFVTACGWMSAERTARITRDAQDQACVAIAADYARHDGVEGTLRLVAHVRAAGRLTPALILRALLCGNDRFFAAAISNLSGMAFGRVAGLVRGGRGLGFEALYARCGLPGSLLPAFRAALDHDRSAGTEFGTETGATLQRARIGRVLAACTNPMSPAPVTVAALLRRLHAEAARDDARLHLREVGKGREQPALLPLAVPETEILALRSAA